MSPNFVPDENLYDVIAALRLTFHSVGLLSGGKFLAMSLFSHLFCDSRESEVGRGGSRSMARRGDRGHNLSVWLELTCAPAK